MKLNDAAALQEQSLYEVHKKIYPRAVHGAFAAWRWTLVWVTQLVFYGGAWLTWNEREIPSRHVGRHDADQVVLPNDTIE